jgi:hypothetical protein
MFPCAVLGKPLIDVRIGSDIPVHVVRIASVATPTPRAITRFPGGVLRRLARLDHAHPQDPTITPPFA